MEYGCIVISNTKKGFTQSVIRLVTRSKYSHSFFTIPSVLGKEMAVEAAGCGISAVPFESAYRNNPKVSYRIYRFKVDGLVKDKAIGKALEKLQTGYGYLELPWFMWRAVNLWFGRDIRAQDNWYQRGEICSEYTSEYISDCEHSKLFDSFGLGSVNAQDILEICEANPELFELTEEKI